MWSSSLNYHLKYLYFREKSPRTTLSCYKKIHIIPWGASPATRFFTLPSPSLRPKLMETSSRQWPYFYAHSFSFSQFRVSENTGFSLDKICLISHLRTKLLWFLTFFLSLGRPSLTPSRSTPSSTQGFLCGRKRRTFWPPQRCKWALDLQAGTREAGPLLVSSNFLRIQRKFCISEYVNSQQ